IISFCLILVIFKVREKNYILKIILTVFMLVFLTIGIWNLFKINETYMDVKNKIHNQQIDYSSIYNLSKEKNVIIIMLDKGISSYLPLIFDERKELKKIFTGFVYYPNTVSFGPNSISAYPALVGGYDYTPFASQMRSMEKCQKKHDEAMLFLPLIFKNNGWNITVTDAPVGHYQYITPNEMFDEKGIDYKNILVNSTGDIYENEYLNKKNTLYFSLV
ncbi:MAG: hypothetical protein LUE64_05870, partial [Candidatus Gastranaerophilales bacterium]|nr:hypothetical protein [Candidatus Gastranaerophilales bacterium]